MMRTIILDTNFLMIPGQYGLDIFTEIERICDFPYALAIMAGTLRELEKICKEQRGKHAQNAKLALSMLASKKMRIIPEMAGDVDGQILTLTMEEPTAYMVATADKALRDRLRKQGVQCIALRNESHLMLI
jgi:uncharacterized protein